MGEAMDKTPILVEPLVEIDRTGTRVLINLA
jgi:hypothetical protein